MMEFAEIPLKIFINGKQIIIKPIQKMGVLKLWQNSMGLKLSKKSKILPNSVI
jgi:hypothetical protein